MNIPILSSTVQLMFRLKPQTWGSKQMKICPKCFFPFLLTSTKFAYAKNLKKRLILICNMCMELMYGIQVLKIDCLYFAWNGCMGSNLNKSFFPTPSFVIQLQR